jgi:hypothetical protein
VEELFLEVKAMKGKLIIALFLMILFTSCEDKKTTYPLFSSVDFFNYTNASVLYFTGDSITYNDFTHQRDSIRFFYIDSLVDIDTNQLEIKYMFDRYISYPNQSVFTYLTNYSITCMSNGVLMTEDLKQNFILPNLFDSNSYWNGHQYQSSDELIYRIQSITNENYLGGNRNIIQVSMNNDFNLIAEDKRVEKYAEGLGIAYSYHRKISKDLVTGEIKSGSIVTLVHNP